MGENYTIWQLILDVAGLFGLVLSGFLVYFRWKDHRRGLTLTVETNGSDEYPSLNEGTLLMAYAVNHSQNRVVLKSYHIEVKGHGKISKTSEALRQSEKSLPRLLWEVSSKTIEPGDHVVLKVPRANLLHTIRDDFGKTGKVKLRFVVVDGERKEHTSRWRTEHIENSIRKHGLVMFDEYGQPFAEAHHKALTDSK